jgi:cation:H+ antiporter
MPHPFCQLRIKMPKKIPSYLWFIAALLFCVQWIIIKLSGIQLAYPYDVIMPGLSVLGASFIMTWGAELAELEISQGLAIAFLALIAVLPEYTVDMYFAWMAGKNPVYTSYATANMTGSNRLLIGLGWSLVGIVYWLRAKKQEIKLESHHRVEIFALVLATIYSFVIPLKGTLSLIDTIVLLSIFVFYIIRATKLPVEEPELEGPPELMAELPRKIRIALNVFLFLLSGFTIFIAAGPFAEGLLRAGEKLGIEKFILVQWLAPIASEAPEFIVAIIFALKLRASKALGVVVSSKINQWTLLIGMLPLVYCISGGHLAPMHLDSRQVEEILITAAQSFFGMVVLANLSLSLKEAFIILVLFVTQLFFTSTEVRYFYSLFYLLIAFLMLVFDKSNRDNFFKLFGELFPAKK